LEDLGIVTRLILKSASKEDLAAGPCEHGAPTFHFQEKAEDFSTNSTTINFLRNSLHHRALPRTLIANTGYFYSEHLPHFKMSKNKFTLLLECCTAEIWCTAHAMLCTEN
jgi:hypothetical protein